MAASSCTSGRSFKSNENGHDRALIAHEVPVFYRDYSSIESNDSRARNTKEMHQMPASATTV
jgi:hypothetical protein